MSKSQCSGDPVTPTPYANPPSEQICYFRIRHGNKGNQRTGEEKSRDQGKREQPFPLREFTGYNATQ